MPSGCPGWQARPLRRSMDRRGCAAYLRLAGAPGSGGQGWNVAEIGWNVPDSPAISPPSWWTGWEKPRMKQFVLVDVGWIAHFPMSFCCEVWWIRDRFRGTTRGRWEDLEWQLEVPVRKSFWLGSKVPKNQGFKEAFDCMSGMCVHLVFIWYLGLQPVKFWPMNWVLCNDLLVIHHGEDDVQRRASLGVRHLSLTCSEPIFNGFV